MKVIPIYTQMNSYIGPTGEQFCEDLATIVNKYQNYGIKFNNFPWRDMEIFRIDFPQGTIDIIMSNHRNVVLNMRENGNGDKVNGYIEYSGFDESSELFKTLEEALSGLGKKYNSAKKKILVDAT